MFARARGTVRRALRALSACLWLRPGGAPPLGTPFSYAAPGQPNELVLLAWGGRPMELLVDDQAVPLALSPSPGRWQHVCVTWGGSGGAPGAAPGRGPPGPGRGAGGRPPPAPPRCPRPRPGAGRAGWPVRCHTGLRGGDLEFQLWSRVLDAAEVAAVAGLQCSGRAGDLLAWAEGGLELHGGVTTLPFDPCP
ncbi:neuronal pentraxin-1-like [Falco biarmicus]|uniref:neuronal pentraxin-1-like n=1 Tax=Falco biarmicus TaxID=345155 RepID=UPI0024BC3016|nr:neuronal pentraxin-1-like [Falco biarmicus]